MFEAESLIDKEHWLASCIHELIEAYQPGNGIDFATAESLLAREKQAFEREVATPGKIHRLYPGLIDESDRSQHVDTAAERSGA